MRAARSPTRVYGCVTKRHALANMCAQADSSAPSDAFTCRRRASMSGPVWTWIVWGGDVRGGVWGSKRGGPTRTCTSSLDEVALHPGHDGSAHNALNVSRSPTSGMRKASESWGCRARRTDPAMARAGCQRSSTSRAAGSAEGSEPHWHPGSCCICSIGTPPSPPSGPTSVRGRADADRVRGKGLSTSVQGVVRRTRGSRTIP